MNIIFICMYRRQFTYSQVQLHIYKYCLKAVLLGEKLQADFYKCNYVPAWDQHHRKHFCVWHFIAQWNGCQERRARCLQLLVGMCGRRESFPNMTSHAQSYVGKGAFCLFLFWLTAKWIRKDFICLEQWIMNPEELRSPTLFFFYALILATLWIACWYIIQKQKNVSSAVLHLPLSGKTKLARSTVKSFLCLQVHIRIYFEYCTQYYQSR